MSIFSKIFMQVYPFFSTGQYLNYGPFGTYAPQYDSTFANMTKDETDILLSTYGDETGVGYAKR
jgi:hypothetical protein